MSAETLPISDDSFLIIMETMDFESDDEQPVRYKSRPQTSHPSRKDRDYQSDVSDMEVDPGSPHQNLPSVQASSSFEHISQTLGTVLSLTNVNDDSGSEGPESDEWCMLQPTPAPGQKTESMPTSDRGLKKNWQPAANAVLGAVHLKNTKDSNSIRQRLHAGEVVLDTQQKQITCDSSNTNRKTQMGNASQAVIESSASSKNTCCRRFSCFILMSCSVLLLLFLVTTYIFRNFHTIQDREKCKLSRYFNKRILKMELEANIFGQHLALQTIPDKIEEYFRKFDENTFSQLSSETAAEAIQICKPLVLSFDGWTGVGKNYISKFISETFQYFTIMNYIVPYNFPHKSLEDSYRLQIQQWILGNFTQCTVNIVVIDEVDKAFPIMIEGLTESIKQLTLPCSSTSPTIFLLLSNTHGNAINSIFLKHLLDSPSTQREDISQKYFDSVFTSEVNEWTSLLSSQGLIDSFVPFLPLERKHVIQCIKRDLVSKRFSTDTETVHKVLQELSFSSFGDIHISQTGCKRVADKVDLVMFEK